MNSVQSRMGKFFVARKTKKALRSYRNSGKLKFPRLYGYRQTPSGIQVVENEAKIIRLVLHLLADGKTVREIKHYIGERNMRNRSGNLLSSREIIEMPKAIYAGFVQGRFGKWVKSSFYEPIVSMETLKKCAKGAPEALRGAKFWLPCA